MKVLFSKVYIKVCKSLQLQNIIRLSLYRAMFYIYLVALESFFEAVLGFIKGFIVDQVCIVCKYKMAIKLKLLVFGSMKINYVPKLLGVVLS